MNPKPIAAPEDLRNADSIGDREWLHAVFERYHRPLVAYSARLLGGNWDHARDCVQDVFLCLCREPREKVEGHIEAWIFKCCRNRAMDWHRKETRMATQFQTERVNDVPHPSLPKDSVVATEEKERLQLEIANLPIREQEVLVLRIQQGLSYKQIAEIMDLSVSHVGVLVHQAVTRLRVAIPST